MGMVSRLVLVLLASFALACAPPGYVVLIVGSTASPVDDVDTLQLSVVDEPNRVTAEVIPLFSETRWLAALD